ncbi:MAG: hypothetical protein Q9178_006165 [Gyalolechia marmorata]
MAPLQQNNFTRVTPTNILNGSSSGRRTRSRRTPTSNVPPSSGSTATRTRDEPHNPTLISTLNIIDGPNTPRKTRRGSAPLPTNSAVKTASTRQVIRHDPMTRRDRAARSERTTRGRRSSTTSRRSSVRTRRNAQGDEDAALDEEDTSRLATTPVLGGESAGNGGAGRTRTAYQGPTASEMLQALEESIADAEMAAVENDENDPETPIRNPIINRPILPRPHPSPPSSSSSSPSRESSPEPTKTVTSSQVREIVTYPNGPHMPPLITYIHPRSDNDAPPNPFRASSPLRHKRHPNIPPPPPPPNQNPALHRYLSTVPRSPILPPLPLPPTADCPGLVLQPPSREHSPVGEYVQKEAWVHQPPGNRLVPREGGYRGGSITRWPNLPDPVMERMRGRGLEVRGEMVVVSGEEDGGGEGEEDETDVEGEEEESREQGNDRGTVRDGGMTPGSNRSSENSEVGDPRETTLEDLSRLFEEV